MWISPVAWPALSLQVSMHFMSWRDKAAVPTSATEFEHAALTMFFASSPFNLESAVLTTTLRHASPPIEFMYWAHALTPFHDPSNTPGRIGLLTSAIAV